MRSTIFGVVFIFVTSPSFSQAGKPTEQKGHTYNELNQLVNNAFNKLVSSNPNPGEVANYASLDPINATFNVKGSLPIHPGRKKRQKAMLFEEKIQDHEAKISYLSFDISGVLIDKNYGALFSNSSLNAGISLGAKYNFRIGKPKALYFYEDWAVFNHKKDILFLKYDKQVNQLEETLTYSETLKAQLLLQSSSIAGRIKLENKIKEADLIQKTIDSLGPEILSRHGLIDTLQKVVQEKNVLLKSYDVVNFALDSISKLGNGADDFLIAERINARNKLKKDYDAIVTSVPLQKLKLTWCTIFSGYSRKSFKTFDASLPFESQIKKDTLNSWNFGLALNHLFQDSLKNQTLFLNLTISHLRNNNLPFLSTTTVEQTRTIRNTTGDIVRTITNKHTVYTDPVKTFNLINITGHVYYVFGEKTSSGFHLQPSVSIQSDKHTVTYLTLGYLVAFQNTVKDQPIINAELYIRFNDLFNNLKLDSRSLNRNEIGISFTVPIKLK